MIQAAQALRDDSFVKSQILLMEDETSVAQGLQMILMDEGYGVDLAETGQSALNSLNLKDFDLLVADLRLPDMDGMEVIKKVKDKSPETEVIVISGYANVPSVVEAMKTGVVEFLPKPFSDDEFKTAIEGALKEKTAVPRPEPGFQQDTVTNESLIRKGEVLRVLGWASDYISEPERTDTEEECVDQESLLHQDKLISLGRLAASVVHEINNPMAGMLNYMRLMIKIINRGLSEREHVDKFKRYLDLIEGETERCSKIVSNLLAFSRKSTPEFRETDINELLQKCIMLTQHKLTLQNIDIKLDLAEDPPKAWGDYNQIQQCVINLIFNAIDAMPEGGTITIGSAANQNDQTLDIQVTDTGCGIDEEDRSRIFDPFFTTKAEGKGLGLGLSTVSGIIDRHKGEIKVDSKEGKGTTFTIKLPIGEKTDLSHPESTPLPLFNKH